MALALDLIQKLLAEGSVLQLATASGDQPWICTVYYVVDEDLNIYWLSYTSRRHSRELVKQPNAAISVAIKLDKPVIGIQAEGSVEVVTDHTQVQNIMKRYVAKYDAGKDYYDNFIAGKNQHQIYKFIPRQYVLFDELHFPENGRQEWQIQS